MIKGYWLPTYPFLIIDHHISKMLVIKRYPNRKLYNTEDKQYITLDEIAELIRNGNDIQVTDNVTGEDLTAVTLSQIIFEQQKRYSGFLPRSVLTSLIQTGGEKISAFQRNLMSSLESIGLIDEEIKARVEILINRGELAESEGRQLLDKLLSFDSQTTIDDTYPDDELIEEVLASKDLPTKNDLEKLVAQLDELNSKLDNSIRSIE